MLQESGRGMLLQPACPTGSSQMQRVRAGEMLGCLQKAKMSIYAAAALRVPVRPSPVTKTTNPSSQNSVLPSPFSQKCHAAWWARRVQFFCLAWGSRSHSEYREREGGVAGGFFLFSSFFLSQRMRDIRSTSSRFQNVQPVRRRQGRG